MWRSVLVLWGLVLVVSGGAGCVISTAPTMPSPDASISECTWGEARGGCACSDGRTGVQVCERGDWGACQCGGGSGCSPSRPTGSCASGRTCVAGSCCEAAQTCGETCCDAGSVCVRDGRGGQACARRCTTNPECPGAVGERCCRALLDPSTRVPLPYGACGTFTAGETTCRCATSSDCGTGACTPTVTSAGAPTLPYICTQPGCSPYGGCPAVGACPTGFCNLCDDRDNCFCARACTSDSSCGGAQCVAYPRSNNDACPDGQRACTPR
jgi:hypothetical protein